MTGPGVRHLINVMGDGSTETQPPNLEEHSEWEHVFLQSDGTDRILTEGTQYLFCKDGPQYHSIIFMHECNVTMIGAAMTRLRIDTHYSIYEVREDCDDTVCYLQASFSELF